MPNVVLYFHMHQPFRLKEINVFDIGHIDHKNSYFYDYAGKDDNEKIFKKVANKSYIPMLSLLLELVDTYDGFVFSLSIPGVFIEQALSYEPKVFELLKKLIKTKKVEIIAETYYHSLAFLYSKKEFKYQIKKQLKALKKWFGIEPKVFRNTELIYSNYIAELIADFDFLGLLTEGVDRYLHGRPRTQVYVSNTKVKIPLLLKHAQLSDDIAFRFGDKNWPMYPLTAEKYLNWIEIYDVFQYVNLFMDFETFGEHQWEDTGIFEFFKSFVHLFLQKKHNKFMTPSQVFESFYKNSFWRKNVQIYDVPDYISWADVDRSITAWRDNSLQYDSLYKTYEIEKDILKTKDKDLIEDWRRLQSSDHFYYMCTKWSADGDVHAYFSPYNDPYEAYRRFNIALADIKHRLLEKQSK